jgi:hypothetical protein
MIPTEETTYASLRNQYASLDDTMVLKELEY